MPENTDKGSVQLSLDHELEVVTALKEQAIIESDFEEAARLRDRERGLKRKQSVLNGPETR